MARSSTRRRPWNWARNNSGGIRPVAADEWASVADAARMLGTPPHRQRPPRGRHVPPMTSEPQVLPSNGRSHGA